MKNSMKPMMAMKSTKVVVKPAAKMAMKKTVMAKPGKSFPDLSKDGKVTKKDILMGRGVIGKKKM
jgi:LysM repeat protein